MIIFSTIVITCLWVMSIAGFSFALIFDEGK